MDANTSHLLLIIIAPLAAGVAWLLFISLAPSRPPVFGTRSRNAAVDARMNLSEGPLGLISLEAPAVHIISLADAFDPEREVLWASQIPVLHAIGAGIRCDLCLLAIERCRRRFPELYEGSTSTAWLQFLHSCRLVEFAGESVRLTADGRELLSLLRRQYDTTRAA